jgi:hypothetical protein
MSFGAGLAQINGMALIKDGYDVYMINSGAARTGDEDYAEFSNKMWYH